MPDFLLHIMDEVRTYFIQNPEWAEQIKIWTDNKTNILIVDRGRSFTKDFEEHLKKNPKYRVAITDRYDARLCRWADHIWQEWANDDAVLTTTKFPEKTVVRLHGWEAYCLGNLYDKIKWNNCKGVVFVADHIKKRMEKYAPIKKESSIVIFNGVNIDLNCIERYERDWRNIGYAGHINEKKNPFLLIQIIKENPEYVFHLRCEFQDPFWKATFYHELADLKNVVYHGRYEYIKDFWNQIY